MIYNFVGSQASVAGVADFKTLGQPVELEQEFAEELIAGGLGILPAEDYSAIGFTAAEVQRFGDAFSRQAAPADFQTKLRAAWMRLAEIRAELTVENEGGN